MLKNGVSMKDESKNLNQDLRTGQNGKIQRSDTAEDSGEGLDDEGKITEEDGTEGQRAVVLREEQRTEEQSTEEQRTEEQRTEKLRMEEHRKLVKSIQKEKKVRHSEQKNTEGKSTKGKIIDGITGVEGLLRHNISNRRNGKKNEIIKDSSLLKSTSTIRFKLIATFLLPIVFIIILGVVSYRLASIGIVRNYEKAASQSINMTGEYMRFGLESIEDTAAQYNNDDTIKNYFFGLYDKDIIELNTNVRDIKNVLMSKQMTDDFIEDIHLISDTEPSLSTQKLTGNGFYGGFLATEQGTFLEKNRMKMAWIGSDTYLDEALATPSTDYSIRLIKHMANNEVYIIIDVKMKAINDILANLKFDQSGYLAVVTSDGKEISPNKYEEAIFTGKSFYNAALASQEKEKADYIDYQGKEYLFMYSKIGDTGAMLCALMPKEVITSQADRIRMVTVIIVILACIGAVIAAFLISNGIDRTIKEIIAKLKKAAKGDLTVQFQSKRKDEFHILIDEIQNTFANMKQLILKVKELSSDVSVSSMTVSETSELFLKSTSDISTAMDEIEQGVSQQAKDAEECLAQMDQLSKKIELVSDNTKEIGQIADSAKARINEGTIVTADLNHQTKSTIETTTAIIRQIERLAEKSSSISRIINVISEIANQTNLLSLNASIEAARAGEYGKGFSVVAGEIRNLAEQSKNSVNDIKKIISSIQEDTKGAAETAKMAAEVLKHQEHAVKNTTASYSHINDSVEQLTVFLSYITENVGNIEEARISTLGAIENISAVLEEIAASTNTVNQTSYQQVNSVGTLNNSAGKLNDNAEILVRAVSEFVVE